DVLCFFFQAEDGIRDKLVTGVQTCALPIFEMQRDPRVIVLGEDIAEHGGAFQVTAGLLAEFGPMRIMQTPISEIGLVGTAVGARSEERRVGKEGRARWAGDE